MPRPDADAAPSSEDEHGRPDAPLGRVLRILESFDQTHPALTVPELAARTGLPPSSVYRIVRELIAYGLLERAGDGMLRTTLRLWELGTRSAPRLRLRSIALPFMEDLRRIVQQHTQLSVLDGTDTVYLERLQASSGVRNIMSPAQRVPARVTSSGLLLAAYLPPHRQTEILGADVGEHWLVAEPPPGARVHEATIEELRRLTARFRRDNFASLPGWITPETAGISVPVRDRTGEVVAALSLILDNDPALIDACLPALRATGASISRFLGWDPPARG